MTVKTKKRSPIASRKVKVKWAKTKPSLSQVYEAGVEYCWVSKDNKQVCPFVYCKDFLHDAVFATHREKHIEIYGFSFDPRRREPINMDRLRMAVTCSKDKTFTSKVPRIIDFLNRIEEELRLIRTRAVPVENPPEKYAKSGIFILEGSNRWMLSPPMLSLYTLLVRVGCVHKVGTKFSTTVSQILSGNLRPYQENDGYQLRDAKTGMDKILKHGYAKIFFKDPKKNYPDMSADEMHEEMGICGYSSEMSKYYIKHWHRDLTKPTKKAKGAKK